MTAQKVELPARSSPREIPIDLRLTAAPLEAENEAAYWLAIEILAELIRRRIQEVS